MKLSYLDPLVKRFNASEEVRVAKQHAKVCRKLGLAPAALGAAPTGPTVTLREIHDIHLVGAAMQTVNVPLPADNEGTQNDQGDPLWPAFDDALAGTALSAEVHDFLEALSLQGDRGDCYALSTLNSLAEAPGGCKVLRSRIVVLTTGSIGVYGFYRGQAAEPVTLVLDYTFGDTGVSLSAAKEVAYKAWEKAWAFARYLKQDAQGNITTQTDSYDAEDGGWMTEVLSFLGIPLTQVQLVNSNQAGAIAANLAAGKALSFGTPSAGVTGGYVEDHAYSVFLDYTSTPPAAMAVNPWGHQGEPANPMYIPIRQADAANFGSWLVCATPAQAFSVPTPPAPTAVHNPGDVNCDGVVDINDLAIVDSHWQEKVPAGTDPWTFGDLNGDGIVDINDLAVVAANWQKHYTSAPWPVAAALLPAIAGRLLAFVARIRDIAADPQVCADLKQLAIDIAGRLAA